MSKAFWVLLIAIGVGFWVQFVKRGPMCTSETDLSGRTVIVTGGNVGIGYESALGLVNRNARVIIACRNTEKAKAAVLNMKKVSGKATVDYMIVDFADMESIRRAADKFMKNEKRLDILINNAGTVSTGRTKDGLDMMFGVNHFGYFIFTNLLMPLMRKTSKKSPVRIINVSSGAYKAGTIDIENLNPHVTVNSSLKEIFKQQSNTKLMNIYFTSELDAQLKTEFKGQDQAITTYSLNPGHIQSNLGKELFDSWGIVSSFLLRLFQFMFSRPTVYGAQTILYCSLEEGIEKFSGGYFENLANIQLEKFASDSNLGKRLWMKSEEIAGVHWEG